MKNTIDIGGYRASVAFDPDIAMFRGEFIDLNGGADFYARDVADLRREGAASLRIFLDMCREDGVDPRPPFSGRIQGPHSTGTARECRRGRERAR